MTLSLAPLTDLGDLRAALADAGLPDSDIGEPGRRFWRCCTEAGAVVGYAGLEAQGVDGLLRSVVIDPRHRGHGHGRELFALMVEVARAQGVQRLWLLTIDAAPFFTKLGFAKVDRTAVPPAIATAREYTTLCPASAACLMKVL